jgi:hypothetical protein
MPPILLGLRKWERRRCRGGSRAALTNQQSFLEKLLRPLFPEVNKGINSNHRGTEDTEKNMHGEGIFLPVNKHIVFIILFL